MVCLVCVFGVCGCVVWCVCGVCGCVVWCVCGVCVWCVRGSVVCVVCGVCVCVCVVNVWNFVFALNSIGFTQTQT